MKLQGTNEILYSLSASQSAQWIGFLPDGESLGFKPISYASLNSQTHDLTKIHSNLSPMLCFSRPSSKFGLVLASSKIYLLLFWVHAGFKPFLRENGLSSW